MADPSRDDAPPAWPMLLLLLVSLTGLFLLATRLLPGERVSEVSWTELHRALAAGEIREVVVSPTRVRATPRDPGKTAVVAVRVDDPAFFADLRNAGVKVTGEEPPAAAVPLVYWVGAAFVVFWLVRARTSQPSALPFGRSHARIYAEKQVDVRFSDVAGADEAIEELQEVLSFLTSPEKFRRLGGKIPKGILLVGPPGTGKTLLARAVAGEARVPFFSISGSEFVELFVGVGAARVRDLFRAAREKAPCIIFIDELDALGKTRVAGPMAHEEREQTLNQLLVELDGFDPRGGVVLMAATNRPEILDPALLRAGRFDRRIVVDRPEKNGRRAILALHCRKVPLAPDVDLDVLAGMTTGMAGADLANLVNEAALLAVRRTRDRVTMQEMTDAFERVVAGLERKTRVLSPQERRRVAVHEIGHALVARALPGTDPVRKISIIPRGLSLGHTLATPVEDRFVTTQHELEARIAVLLGGRAAEELMLGELSTGAHDDLERATRLAASMVRDFGMNRRLGARTFSADAAAPVPEAPTSEETAREIDEEIRWILEQQEARATRVLAAHRALLDAAAARLVERETIYPADLDDLEAAEGNVAALTRPSPVEAAPPAGPAADPR